MDIVEYPQGDFNSVLRNSAFQEQARAVCSRYDCVNESVTSVRLVKRWCSASRTAIQPIGNL